MNKRHSVLTFVLMAVIAASMSLASCGKLVTVDTSGSTSEGTVTGNTGELTLLYEGYNNQKITSVNENGEETESRIYQWLFENTSGEEIEYVDLTFRAFDENGKSMSRDFEDHCWPNIKPGEKIWATAYEDEWESAPASFGIEIKKIKLGKGNGEPLSIIAVDPILQNDYNSVYELTIRNDGGNDVIWYNERMTFLPLDAGRQFRIVGAERDSDGNIIYADETQPIADENTFAELEENITFAPGEEKVIKVMVIDNSILQDPEFLICWY